MLQSQQWPDGASAVREALGHASFRVFGDGVMLDEEWPTWPINFDPPARIVVDPPKPVVVDLAVAIARTPAKLGISVPLRVKAEGLSLDNKVSGHLLAWARSSTGDWLCRLMFCIPTGNGKGFLEVDQWCPSGAVTLAEPDHIPEKPVGTG